MVISGDDNEYEPVAQEPGPEGEEEKNDFLKRWLWTNHF
jgi:hypothetical protein